MDLKLASFYATAELQLRDPAGVPMLCRDGSPMTIEVKGEDCPEYQRLRAAYLRKISGRNYKPDPADAQQYELDVAAALTAGWRIESPDGTPIPYTPETAKELYRQNDWVANQVTKLGLDRGNFLMSSSPTS